MGDQLDVATKVKNGCLINICGSITVKKWKIHVLLGMDNEISLYNCEKEGQSCSVTCYLPIYADLRFTSSLVEFEIDVAVSCNFLCTITPYRSKL